MSKNANINVFVPITKVDKDKRMVYGYATTEALDSHGEVVSKKAIEKALPDYLRWGNIREMHQPSAVGKTKESKMDEKGLYIGVKVVDDSAWAKVKEAVYQGFSIGGRKLAQKGKEITELVLSEISLVDRPANPEAVFDVFKAEYNGETSHDEKRAKLWEALNPNGMYMFGIVEVFGAFVIVRDCREEEFYSYPYTMDADGNVTFGEPSEVKLTWQTKEEPVNAMHKVLGYTPWWAKMYTFNNSTLKNALMQKADEQKPSEEQKPPVEAPKPAEAPTSTPPGGAEQPPVEPTVEPEKPTSTPDAAPAEPGAPVEKAGAKFSKETMAALQTMAATLNALIANTEKAEQPTNLSKLEGPQALQKVLDSHLAKVGGMIDEAIKPLKEQVDVLKGTIQPVKANATYVQTKGNEALEGGDREKKTQKYNDVKARLDELQKIRTSGSVPMNDFMEKYGAEIEGSVTELRTLKSELGL